MYRYTGHLKQLAKESPYSLSCFPIYIPQALGTELGMSVYL